MLAPLSLLITLLPASSLALPMPLASPRPRQMSRRALHPRQTTVDPNLVPQFGVVANTNPDGTGNCEGVNGAAIPCDCPPDRATFISDLEANVAAGAAVNNSAVTGVTFPTGNDVTSALARFNAATITLQNLQGAGVGCPQTSTTFAAQIAAIQSSGSADSSEAEAAITQGVVDAAAPSTAGVSEPAPTASASVSATAEAAASTTGGTVGGIDVALVPQFGITANTDPDGTGNCAGANGVAIPCDCPPDRNTFISDLAQNVAAGFAVNNTAVTGVTFPTGSDKNSVLARLNAATITLQNLQGAGVGCPQASTTFGAQVQAADALPS